MNAVNAMPHSLCLLALLGKWQQRHWKSDWLIGNTLHHSLCLLALLGKWQQRHRKSDWLIGNTLHHSLCLLALLGKWQQRFGSLTGWLETPSIIPDQKHCTQTPAWKVSGRDGSVLFVRGYRSWHHTGSPFCIIKKKKKKKKKLTNKTTRKSIPRTFESLSQISDG